MQYEIRRATTADDLDRVARLRFDVYVEEMGRAVAAADHEGRRVTDELDVTASIFLAVAGEEPVGTIRMNLASDPGTEAYRELYELHRFNLLPAEQLAIVTKLIVVPRLRGGRLAIRLCQEIGAEVVRRGVAAGFIDANAHLHRFYARLGFRPYAATLDHPEYGTVTPMVLLVSDHEHLRSVRSPLLPALAAAPSRSDLVGPLRRAIEQRAA